MLANILDQVIKTYGKEFLGDWDPINNFRIDSLTDPEIHLTNIPFPQQLFELAEIPFAVDYSNIAKGDRSSVAQTIEPRIVNSLSIRARNIHVHIVDDNLGVTPWAFECHVDEFCIDSPKRGDPRVSEMEATGLEQCLLMGLWMRFLGMHFWYREFPRPQLEGKAGVSVNINRARELRRRLRRNPGDEEAQRLLSKLLQKDAATAAADAAADVAASEAAASSASTASAQPDAHHRHTRASQIHPDLRLLHQRASDAGVEVDAGALTTMLSKEIQETLRIEDQSVSHSLASRFLQWAWFCGKDPQQRAASPPHSGVLTPLRAETILGTDPITISSRPPEERLTSSLMQHLAPQGPAAAAATAAVAAKAAADAADLAKDAAAKALRSKEEERESSTTSDSSSDEADLLVGVRAARAFKVVPSQIKDLLDDNTHAFRITPKNGIEMQILFKKWELRALGSSLAVNKQSWKSVELSFLHHDPTLYSPHPGAAASSKQQQEEKEHREAVSVPPPLFDGSMEHKPLQLTFTSAAVAALFNFVKLIDTWFVFMKGAARPIRPERLGSLQWATGETAETRIDGVGGADGGPTDKERLLLEDIAYTVDEASGDERGGFGGKRWFYIDGLLSVVAPNLCFRLLPLIQPGMHVACPTHLQRQEQPRQSIRRHGTLALLEHLENQQSMSFDASRPQPPSFPLTTLMFRVCTDFKFRQEKRNDAFKCQDIFIDSVFVEKGFAALRAQPANEAVAFRAPHDPELQTPLPDLIISARSMGRMGCSTCVYLPADPPSRLGWGIGPARPPLRGYAVVVPSAATGSPTEYTEYDMIGKDEFFESPPVSDRSSHQWHMASSPAVHVESPQESGDGEPKGQSPTQHLLPQRIRPSRVYSNLHAFFHRARHLAEIVKKTPKKNGVEPLTPMKRRGSIGADRNRTIFISMSSKLLWDEELGGPIEKKKTWVNVPEISICAPELIPLAEALPMSFVTWDLFKQKDCLLPASTEDAMGLALGYCQHVDRSLRLTVQKATLIYRLSSLDYSRVLSHVKRDALAEARELQQQAAAEAAAAQAAAQAAAARTWRFGGLSWEGRAALSDGGSPSSSSSSSSLSAFKGRWRQAGWAERAAAAAAAGIPLAFLGERGWDGRREFEANRRLISRNSSSSQSLPDSSSDRLSFSDSFLLSSSLSEGGRQASGGESAKSQPQLDFPGGELGEDSDEDTFVEDSAGRFRLSGDSGELSVSDLFYEPVEEHGFSSACKGLKATVTTLRLNHTIAKRKLAITSDELNLTVEAAEAAVLAQPLNSNGVPSATEDCQVALISNVNVGVVKARQNKVKVAVGRMDLGVCTQLVSLAASKNFLMPVTYPYSDSLRDTPTLKLKLAQIGTLQRKTPLSKAVKTASKEHALSQQVSAASGKEAHGSDASSSLTGDANEGAATTVAAARQSEEDDTPARRQREGDLRAASQSKPPEAFLPVPTTGPWAVCDGTRYEWFFHEEELAQKFLSGISPLKFTGPGQEDKESFQRWRVAKNLNSHRKDEVQVPEGAETDGVGSGAAAATTAVISESRHPPLQVFAKVGCLSVGLYTQQQHLAVLLRVYEARVQLRKKQKDIRLKANVGELFVEHLKVRGLQRRSIVLCKKVVHVGGQCRRFPKLSATSPTSATRARDPHPAALLRSEMSRWSGSSRHTTSSSPSPHGRLESSGSPPGAQANERDAGSSHFDLQKGNEANDKKDMSDGPVQRTGGASTTQSAANDGKPSLREQMLQYQWRRDHQAEQEKKLHFAQDEEAGPSNNLLMRKEELLGAGFAGNIDKISVASDRNDQQKPAENAEAAESACDNSATHPESISAEKEKTRGPLRLSIHPRLQSKRRSVLMRGLPHPPDMGFRSPEKARISEFLANSRSRFTPPRQQHAHWGLPWHGRTGAAHDSDSAFPLSACDSDSSLDESGQMEATDTWYPDVVGGWTLRDDSDRVSDAGATPDQHPGHDCCFGIPEAPLNLLLFEDTYSKRLTGNGGKRKELENGDLKLPLKGNKNRKRDQLCLSLHLEPDSKTTEAQLSLQSLHAFPTANLLCCLTDAALFLKSQWEEESIRSRCLLACLSCDACFQKTADLAGLNLQSATEKEAKRPTKRQFTLNRRLRQQSSAFNKNGSGGSEGGSDTNSSSTSSALLRKLSRGRTELRKQARTTFSRWGPPEGFSEGDSSPPTGLSPGDASRRASRSQCGSRRRRKIYVPASSREKTRISGASGTRDQRGGIGNLRSSKELPYSRGDAASENTKDGSSNQPFSAEGSSDAVLRGKEHIDSSIAGSKQTATHEEPPVRGVRVSVELMLEDVTCNLLTDDAADTEGLNETEPTSSLSRESAALEATPGFGSPSVLGTLTAPSLFLTQQQEEEKRMSLRNGRRYGQLNCHRSNSDSSRDAGSTASTSSTLNGSGDDAGLAFPPFPVLFSPDLCVPSHTPGMAEGMSLHSSSRRAVIADAAALGVRLEAALRLSYTSVPTSSSPGKKREELKDTLRVGLWRAECLRLLPVKKRRAGLGTAKSGGKLPDASRSADDNEAPEKRLVPLHTVDAHDSEGEDESTRALQHTLWLAEGVEAHPPSAGTHSRGRQRFLSLKGWDERPGSSVWQDGYESADGPAHVAGYQKRTKIDGGGVDEGTEGEERHKREDAQAGSCSDAGASRLHPAGRAPRRIPSSGSSSFFRRVFGSRGASSSHVYGFGASPANDDPLLRAHDFKQLAPGVARNRIRSGPGAADQAIQTDGGPEANFTDAATHRRQEQQRWRESTSMASPLRRRASSVGWPRSLLKSRRSLSILNGTEEDRPAPSTLEGQETRRLDPNKTDIVTGSGDISSASPQEAGGRGRQRAIDLEIKRVAVWSAVYLQENKAAANPCRAAAASIAADLTEGLAGAASPRVASTATATEALPASAETRNSQTVTAANRAHRSLSHLLKTASPRIASPYGTEGRAAKHLGAGGTSSPARETSGKPAAGRHVTTPKQEKLSRLRRAAQEWQHLTNLLDEVWAEDWLSVSIPSPPPFGLYFRQQEGRVLLLPVLLRASNKNERHLLQQRLQEAKQLVDSAAPARKKRHSSGDKHDAAVARRGAVTKLREVNAAGALTAAAVVAGFPLNTSEQRKTSAAAQRLKGAANLPPHFSAMYRLIDETGPSACNQQQPSTYTGSDANPPKTKVVCRADVFPTFCACTPFLVDAYSRMFGKEGEMTAVLSRLSMGLRAVRLGMQKQQQTAAEATKAAAVCLPGVASSSEAAAAVGSSSLSEGAEHTAANVEQRQEPPFDARAVSMEMRQGRGPARGDAELPEKTALLVDRRLWGSLPGSLLQLGFGLRAALDRLTHDAFVSLCIHSLQLTLPSPCQLLSLPAIPATRRLLPVTALRSTLTSDPFYFVCCLAAAPSSPCIALDLVLTLKGIRKDQHFLAKHPQQKWTAKTAATLGRLGSTAWPRQVDVDGRKPRRSSMPTLQFQQGRLSSPTAGGVAGATPAAASVLDGMPFGKTQQERTRGSIEVTFPLLRLELLKRPRLLDNTSPSASDVARAAAPRIALSAFALTTRPDGAAAPGGRISGNEADQTRSNQSDCVLEVLLKDLEVTFVSEKQSQGMIFQKQPLQYAWTGRQGAESEPDFSRLGGLEGFAGGQPRLNPEFVSRIEPFRMIASLKDCIIRGEDGSILLQNASCIPKLFSGDFASGTGAPSVTGGATSQGPLSAVGISGQHAAGGATPTGAQGTNQDGGGFARRPQQKARLSVQQALASEMPLQDPLLQSLLWVSDGMVFMSGEAAYLRIQLKALQAAAACSWGLNLFGALQQMKHFRLHFPAISFGCCFSTASCLSPLNVKAEQLLRIWQLQSRGPPASVLDHQQQPEDAEEHALRRSLLLQQRSLGILCLLYPSLPPPAMSPKEWVGYLPLQLPEVAPPISVQLVLKAIEAEAATREATTSTNATDEAAAPTQPWRLQTADLFQHHSDLRDNLQLGRMRSNYGRSSWQAGDQLQRAASAELLAGGPPYGKSSPVGESRGMTRVSLPTLQEQSCASVNDPQSDSSPDGTQHLSGVKEPEGSAARVKKPRSAWSWLQSRGERKRFSTIYSRPSGLDDLQWQRQPSPLSAATTMEPSPKATRIPSASEAGVLAARLQKVVELSLKGVEVWLVVGAADGENALHDRIQGDQNDALAVAGISSLKNRRKVLLTAANRKGLCCVEEEMSEDRRKQQIVVGLLVACSVRLLQKGPEVNVCGDISELSAMVGSPVRCNDFVLPKTRPMMSLSPGGRSAAQHHPVQLTYSDSPRQQQHLGGTTSSMEPAFGTSLAPSPEAALSEKQQDFHQGESVVKLYNFPDVLEGYGGALLLPNLQQRTDCVLSLAPSTATVSGTPGGKAKICVTIVDPQIHFSFEMFQGIVSLETQVRLEQLQVSKAAAAAIAALKASVAAAAAAAEADAAALIQQRALYEQVLPPPLPGRPLAPVLKEIPPPSPSEIWANVQRLRTQDAVFAVQEGGGGLLAEGQQRTFASEGGGVTAGGNFAVTAAAAPGTTAAIRVTNYSVSMGDVSMEGSLLLFLRNYVFTLRDSAAPAGSRKQRPLFGWTGNNGGADGGPQRPVVNAIDLLRLHQQRRGGAIGRVIEELHAMSSKPIQPPEDEASPASSSVSSVSSVSPPEVVTQAEVRSQSWGPGEKAAQQKPAESLQTGGLQRQSSHQMIPLHPATSLTRSFREIQAAGGVGDEEAVASEELLLLANLMAAGCHSATRAASGLKDAQGVNGLPLTQQQTRQHQQDRRESEPTRRYAFEVGETPLMAAAAEEGAPVTIALLQGVGEADFTDPFCRVIGLFLSLLSFKIPGETELEIKGEVVQGAFEFHDAHGSLLKISLLAFEGQIFIHPELWSADSVKEFGGRLEVMASGYDPMTNSQEELLHPVSASVEIQRQYVDGQASHWSLVNIRSAMDGVSVDITSGLLQLVYHIVRTTHEILQGAEGSLGRLTSLRVYNDIHSDVLVMHRRRSRDEPTGWDYSRMQPEEWILAPTTSLYFAVRKHLAAAEAPPEKRRPWRRGNGAHQKLNEAQPTLRLDSYEEVKRVVEGLLQLGTNKVDNAWLRAYEETLLFASTRKAQAPLEMLVDDMPVLQGGGNLSVRYGWEGLLQLLRREPGWCCMGRLHADYSNCRAYFLQNAGFKVLVEPVVDRRNGTWSLTVGSCVQLANACSMTLRVYVGRMKRNWGGRAISCFAARVTGETRGNSVAEEYIDVLPGCRRSVPLSWFGNGSMPSLTALLHTEDGGEKVARDAAIENSPEIPPVAFAALYKLTNKTGYAQPRRLDIPPFTLRLRGSLMLYGTVDTTDVPTSQASRIAQRYVIKLEPMLSIRNTLPFPITVAVYLRHTVETQQARELGASAGGAAATGAPGSNANPARESAAPPLAASSTEVGLSGRYAFGNAQAGLLAELESRKRQKQEAQQSKSRGTAAKLVANSYVEATIPSHQSWGLPVGEQRLWLVLRVHGAPLEQFNTQLGAFNPTDGRPLGPVELQLLASAALRGPRLGGTTWLLQQDFSEGVAAGSSAVDAKASAGNSLGGATAQQRKQQLREPPQPATVYESQRFVVLLPTQDTVTVSKVLQLKDGRGESLLPPAALRLARAEALNQRRGRKASSVYSEMQLAADVSRRQITVFAPYFFENLTDATLWVNGALVPSRCRLYTTEEDMRAASIKAYKVDLLADRVLQSPLSRKHDLSGISTARPPLILKLTAMKKQRGIRFAWGARGNSIAKDEPRQSQEGDSVISSLNAGAGAERPTLVNLGSDVARDAPQGDSPSFKPTPSSTDSFVDDEVLGQRPHDKRLRFSPKRPANTFAAARRNISETFSAIGENEEDALSPSRRGRSLRVKVQRRVQKLGGVRRARKLRKSYEAQGFDSSGADSGEKEGTLTSETRDQSIPPRTGSGVVVPNVVSPVDAAPRGNGSNNNGSSTPPPTLVLGLCTRYGDAPYSTTKIVSVIPRYMFISRLPFSVLVREVRSRSRVLGGAMSGRPKSLPCELSLLPGETKAFHGVEPRVLLAHVAKSLVSCPFSLCPAHVPSFFQVEMTPRGLGAQVYLPEHCTIIQVSIVSGLFGDVPALPYTYNGSFIVLSLPEYPQFAILNLTSYFLAHAPAERNRRSQQNHLRDDAFAIPIASGPQAKSTNKKNREDSDASLRLIPPWGSVPFIPPYHKNLENTRVRLRVLDVDHCPWSVHSLASVDEELQTIEFIPRQGGGGVGGAVAASNPSPQLLLKSPRSADGNTTARKVPLLQRLPTKTAIGTAGAAAVMGVSSSSSNHQQQPRAYQGAVGISGVGGPSDGGYPGLDEDVFATQEGDLRLGRPQTPRAGQGTGGSNKEKQPATLYVFALVAASGSRILIVAESRDVAAKLRAGGSAFDMVREELVGSSVHAEGAVGAAAAVAAAAAGLSDSVGTSGERRASAAGDTFAYASIKPKEAGGSSGDVHARETLLARELTQRKTSASKNCQQRPPPWLALSFEFRLPRLTVTWIHQSEVVLALHLTGLSLSGAVSPRQLDAFLEAVPLERVLQISGGGAAGAASRQAALMDSSAGGGSPAAATQTASVEEVEDPTRSNSPAQDSTASPVVGELEEDDALASHGGLQQQQQQQPLEDYAMLVMTRSAVSLSARISMLHVDHFVKGDIPVILKNTASKYGKESEEFLEVAVVRSLVDPRQAPTYDLLEIRISPFSANIELLVIEQLIRIYEKELEMLYKFAVAAPQKPPALQTALKCSDAAEALRQLAVMDLLEANRKEAALAGETNAGATSAAGGPRAGASASDAAAGGAAHAAAAAFLKHPLSYDLSHPGSRSMVNAHSSMDRARHTSSLTGGFHHPLREEAAGGAEARNTEQGLEALLREPAAIQFYACPRVFINPPSSHVLVLPNPRWMELHRASPVYIKNLIISSLSLTVSIRTSEHRISRQVLHIVDALPLDTPYMAIQIARERRKFTVCSWHELLHSLRNSYLRQFIRQSLPSAWISNPCAFVVGFLRGTVALFRQTIKGAKTSQNSFEGIMTGFRVGFILFIIYTMGGVMQSLSHVLNILHKLMRGSRPRPYGVLDAFWKGLNGMLLDTFWRPWVAVVAEPAASATRGDSWWKTTAILLACCVRCLISPLFGLSNFLASVAEGFANTLIGDFEQFTRVQERADLDKKHKHLTGGEVAAADVLGGSSGLRHGRSRSGDVTSGLGHGDAAGAAGGAAAGLGSRFRRGKWKAAGETKHGGLKAVGRSKASDVASATSAPANDAAAGGGAKLKPPGGSFSNAFRRASSKQVTFAL
ncbi:hypothetical protein Emag_003766 [Eimeria magna]